VSRFKKPIAHLALPPAGTDDDVKFRPGVRGMAAKSAFISHISQETDLAQGLKTRIQHDFLGMIDVFVSSDGETIRAGTKWLDAVDAALERADIQLVLCSTESVGRPWVNFEAGAAWIRDIPVVPVCHSCMTPDRLPSPLNMLQSVQCGPDGMKTLYRAIAGVLGVDLPNVDYDELAAEMARLEERHRASTGAVDSVPDPTVLCAASEQYSGLGFDLDVGVVEATFPAATIERKLTRKRLTELLLGDTYEIIHLVTAVDPETGDLIFSPIDFGTYRPLDGGPVDRMTAGAFADLLRESETRLVVLATCKALLLAVDVSDVATMAASDAIISGTEAAEWAESFYGLLAQGMPVFKAYEITRKQVSAPIRLVRKRDVTFSLASS
jgi:hypothetical protein